METAKRSLRLIPWLVILSLLLLATAFVWELLDRQGEVFPDKHDILLLFLGVAAVSTVIIGHRLYKNLLWGVAARERRLGELLDELPVIFWTADEGLHITEVHGGGMRNLELDPRSVIGLHQPQITIDDAPLPESLIEAHYAALTGERVQVDFTLRNITFAGTVEPRRDTDGRIDGTAALVTDITSERHQLEELRRERDFNATMIQATPAMVAVANPEGLLFLVNPRFEQVMGTTTRRAAGMNLVDTFVEEEMRDEVREHLRRVGRESESSADVRVDPWRSTEGRRRWVEWHARALHDLQGNLVGVLVFGQDVTSRRETEERLRRLATIVHSNDAAIVSVDLEGKVRTWNSGAEELYGYTAVEMMGQPYLPVIPPEEREKTRARIRHLHAGETLAPFRSLRRHKSGRIFHALVSVSALRNAAGEIVGSASIARDISGQVRAELALRESEERFRMIAENAQDIIYRYRIRPELQLEYVSPSVERITGYSPEEIEADPTVIFGMLSEQDGNLLNNVLQNGVSQLHPKTVQVARPDGTHVWLEARTSLVRDDEGRLVAMDGIARDVTARRHAEEALRTSESRFRSIIEQSHDAIFVITEDGFEMVNPQFERMLGYRESEVTRSDFDPMSVVSPSYRRILQDTLDAQEVGRDGRVQLVFTALQRDGTAVDLDLSGSFVDWDGQRAFLGLLRDVSQQRMVEQERQRYYEARLEAEKKHSEAVRLAEETSRLASVGVIAAGITHEINQPLNAIRLGADGILMWNRQHEGELPEIFIELVGDIAKASQRIATIVQHMRSYWQPMSPESLEPVELNRAVQQALSLVGNQLQSHAIELERRLAAGDLFLSADGIQLEQIVNNLVTNAVHALDGTGREDKLITVWTDSTEEEILLGVADNGPGLDTSDPETLFDPFYSTKQPGVGMGLGLAIVNMFVQRFGGRINVHNRDAGGAEFVVRFPRVKTTQHSEVDGEDPSGGR